MSTPTRTRPGIPWHAQRLGEPLIEVLRRIRRAMFDGQFSRRALDHNSLEYTYGLSNKQVKIAGATLLGRTDPSGNPTYDECFDAVMEALLGGRP